MPRNNWTNAIAGLVMILAIVSFAGTAFAVDVAPVVSLSANSTSVTTSVTLTAVAVDVLDNAGIQWIKIYENGGLLDTKSCGGISSCTFVKVVTKASAGIFSYYSTTQDNGGHITTSDTVVVMFDTQAPVTTDNAPVGWQNSDVIVTLTPSDPSPSSGLAWTRYCTNSIDTCDPAAGTNYVSPVTISTEGTTYFRYASADNAGNVQVTVSRAVMIDKTDPIVADNYANDGVWVNANQIVTLSPSDTVSGLAVVRYCEGAGCNPDTGTVLSSPYQLSYTSDQDTIVRYRAYDNAGRHSAIGEYNVKLDKSAPTTADDYASKNGIWQTSDQTITLTENCVISGCSWTRYCMGASCDPAAGTDYTIPVPFSTEGTTIFRYASRDNAGNTQAPMERSVKIDKTDPTITDNYAYDDVWVNSDQTVTLSPSDAVSGVAEVRYCEGVGCNPIIGTLLASPYQLSYTTGQNTTVRYYARDNAGRNSTIGQYIVKLDKTLPSWSGLVTAPASSATYAPGQNYQFNVTWNDNVAIDTVVFEFNGANYTPFAAGSEYYYTLNGLAADTYNYAWYANDTTGNWNSTGPKTYVVSPATTVLTLSASPGWNEVYRTETNVSCSVNNAEVTPQLYRNGTLVLDPDVSTLAAGSYDYTCNATATQNWTAASTSSTLSISKAPTTVNLTLNGAEANLALTYPETVTATYWTDVLTATMYRNGTDVSSENGTALGRPAGYYNYTVENLGNENYTASSKTFFVTVNKAQSVCSLLFDPASPQPYGTVVNASAACTNPEASPALWRNGADVTATENNIYTLLAAGVHNYVANVSETQNWTAASNTSSYTIEKGASSVALLLNDMDANQIVERLSTVNLTGQRLVGEGDIELLENGNVIGSGATGVEVLKQYTLTGPFNITVRYLETENYTAGTETHVLTVQDTVPPAPVTGLAETEIGAYSIVWSWTNPSDDDFSHVEVWVNGTWKANVTGGSYNATGLELGTTYELQTRTVDDYDNINPAWANDSATTLEDGGWIYSSTVNGSYYESQSTSIFDNINNSIINNSTVKDFGVDNILILDSNIDNTTIENSWLTAVNASGGSAINNSILTNCVVINATVKNIVASNCYLKDGVYDPPGGGNNLTGSNITNSYTYQSNVTYSNVTYSNITYSNVNNSVIDNSNISYSTVYDSTVRDSTLYYATVINGALITGSQLINSTADNSTITNSVLTRSNATDSTIVDSVLTDTTVTSSTLTNITATNSVISGTTIANAVLTGANLTDGVLYNGTITLPDNRTYNATDGIPFNLSNPSWPSVSLGFSPSSVDTNTAVTFTASISGQFDTSTTITYEWDFDNNGIVDQTSFNSTTALKTYSAAASYAAKVTVRDGHGNSASNTVALTVAYAPAPSGGGSGSSWHEPQDTATYYLRDLFPGMKYTIAINLEDIALTSIEFSVNESVSRGEIKVRRLLDGTPSGLENVYQYIEASSTFAGNMMGVSVSYKINNSWLAANKLDNTKTRLARYHDGTWKYLSTAIVSERNDYTEFTSVAPGFSTFAITVPKVIPPQPQLPPEQPEQPEKPVGEITVAAMPGGSPTFVPINVSGLAVTGITVTPSVRITDVKILAKPVAESDVLATLLAGTRQYFELSATSGGETLGDSGIENVKIIFKLSKADLKDNGLDASSVRLERWSNGCKQESRTPAAQQELCSSSWQSLPTTKVSEDNEYVTYEAVSTGFSLYAIAASAYLHPALVAIIAAAIVVVIAAVILSKFNLLKKRKFWRDGGEPIQACNELTNSSLSESQLASQITSSELFSESNQSSR